MSGLLAARAEDSGVAGRVPLALVGAGGALVERVRAGDHAAFRELFESYYIPLCKFAVRYVESMAVAEELVADVFAAVWLGRATLVVPRRMDQYLFGAVRNRALNAQRNAATAQRLAVQSECAASTDHLPEDHSELDTRVRALVDALPPKCHEVTRLHWFEQLSYREVAERTGLSMAAVKKHIERALASLRAAMT